MKAIKGMPMFSPVRGNAFGKAMADAGGDYEKAKAMLDNDVATMKAQYGTGAPTKMHLGVPHPQSIRDRVKKDQQKNQRNEITPDIDSISRSSSTKQSTRDKVKRDQQKK